MTTFLNNSELGKKSAYETTYNPNLLFPIARSIKRSEIGIDDTNTGFIGVDIWTHYEISWLDNKGKPCVAIGEISYPASSKNIIESKSMKLYFNSFNNTKFVSANDLITTVVKDLSIAVESTVEFKLLDVNTHIKELDCSNKICLDNLDVECGIYQPYPQFLTTTDKIVTEHVFTNLLKSNCLVTFQPDWGSLFVEYTGNQIDHEGLLRYVVSLRNHNEFHEQCVERIFNDIIKQCNPQELTVYARYTRRGGLDINPFRTTKTNLNVLNNRLTRQ